MDKYSCGRVDLISIFNQSTFKLRYFSRTYYQVYTPDWSSMPVNRMFCPLIVPDGDESYIEDQHTRHKMIPGNLYFVPPYLPTRWKLSGQLNFLSIHTHLEVLPGVELFSNCPKIVALPWKKKIREILKYIYSPQDQAVLASQCAGAKIYSLLISLMDHYSVDDFWGPLLLKRYSKISEYLLNHGNAQTSVSDIANLYGESRESFSRNFSAYTGITPKQMIDRYIVRRCIDLLSSGCSIKETAFQLKFSNEFAFSRYFKRLMGESPNLWKKHQENPF